MNNVEPKIPGIDWGQLRFWQTVDPVPWWILDREKLQQIMVVQLETKIAEQKMQLEQLQKIRDIVAGKGKSR
ncbi:MAG TPA: hypothetical protein VMT71_18025 [Syntrophorhabdales bacterium]|nr:hypothetical protein [Syntrophorhabdales bacterium]